ncbi:cleft lip and palate transmembrane protein 1-domain-containing protein [Syncephalis fuscata]|nr:cleft lip and palate transmembrane protein 1-domain-containing protein [Syncephalis fuscata]
MAEAQAVRRRANAARDNAGDNNGNDDNHSNSRTAQQQESTFSKLLSTVMRMLFFYWIFNYFQPSGPGPNVGQVPTSNATNGTLAPATPGYAYAAPLWPFGTLMDLLVYVDENETFNDFSNTTGTLVWKDESIMLGDWNEDRMASTNLSLSNAVQHNASLYAHIYLVQHGELPNHENGSVPLFESAHLANGTTEDYHYAAKDFVYQRKLLTYYLPKRHEKKTKHLLGNKEMENADEVDESQVEKESSIQKPTEIISYWYRNLTVNVVTEEKPLHLAQMPPNMKQHVPMERTGIRDTTGTMPFHLPVIYLNDFWVLDEHFMPINETTSEMPLTLIVYPISMLKFQLYSQMDDSFNKQQEIIGTKRSEIDQLKRTLLETNPWLLAFTAFVSVLHSVFDFLAFKNDITFWKERKDDVAGLSVRTIGLNIFFQLVILLYLLDNEETTSWIILISQGIGLAIECWKVKKAVDIKIYQVQSVIPWRIQFNSKASYTVSKTEEYDEMAFRYLSWVTYPLLFGYAIYSMVYQEHRGWYSYIINTLVGFVYTFGFVAMTPQLFINYKLKSVAHMPWKTFMYKALNTFVDDLFAFWIIRMPVLHRLACLRDDVVFFVYLYQRWIYPVDPTRANEFGQVGETNEEEKEKVDESRKDQ